MNDPTEEEQLSEILADAPWVAFAFRRSADGRYTVPYASAGIERLFGLDRAQLKADGARLLARVHPDDVDAFTRSIERSAETLSPWSHAFRVVIDGVEAWIEGSSRPVREQDGAVLFRGVCHDVTERRDLRAQLQAQREILQLLIAQAPVSIAMLDRELRYLAASERWAETFGVVGVPLVGRLHYEVFPDLPENLRASHRAGLAGVVGRGEREPCVGPTGEKNWLRWAVHPWRDGAGQVGGIIIFVEDVTARVVAEALAREGDARLEAIVRSAMDGVISIDEHQRILLANPAAERMFGYGAGELTGKALDVLLPVGTRAEHQGHVHRFGETQVTQRAMGTLGAVMGLRSNGETFPIEASISQVEVGGKKLFTSILRDVSERERTLHALEEQQARFRQLAESIREVFWLTDIEKQKIVYVSPAYQTIWGRSCESLYADARQWLDAVHPEDRERIAHAARHMQSTGAYDEHYRIVRPDGAIRWIHDRAFPVMDPQGVVVRVAGVAEDETERRGLEEQLRQTQKMEAMGRLAGGVAHDFNNLLTVIVSSAELLREGADIPPEDAELVQDILDAGRRGATLTRQLLAFTRQEVIEPRVTDLGDIVADAEKLLRRLLGEDLSLVTRLASSATPVRVDPGQWSQVVLNLAVNARDAMPRGGCLTIETRSVDATEAFVRTHPLLAAGRYAVLTVRDEGTGMSAEVRARIFEPFFTTKGLGKGTGLGLAVVYGVVHQAGGHIEVESALGAGTTVTIYVPAARGAAARAAIESLVPADAAGRETILLVEDEVTVRRVATRILESRGYTVLAASDGVEALELVRGHVGGIDLLLTDVVMPRLDGPSLASEVRRQHPTMQVLFASGYIDDALSRRGVTGEGTNFLQKPYTPAMLLRRVRAVLDRR